MLALPEERVELEYQSVPRFVITSIAVASCLWLVWLDCQSLRGCGVEIAHLPVPGVRGLKQARSVLTFARCPAGLMLGR